MKKILTGIQPTGNIHLGNILGAILPTIKLSNNESNNQNFICIADLHSLTSIKDGNEIYNNSINIASALIAFGFDCDKNYLYRQSKISEISELYWILNCYSY